MIDFIKTVLNPFSSSVQENRNRNAFCIKGKYYSYSELGSRVLVVRNALKNIPYSAIGLVPNDDLDTYASIFALWLEGKYYIPLHPTWPIERCRDIIEQVDIRYVLDSSENSRFSEIIINLHDDCLPIADMENCIKVSDNEIAYILFTSGSTGKPKGVPISRKNLGSFIEAVWAMGLNVGNNDRCLQCFELTFDLSVFSYLVPLLRGACVYTVPSNVIKYGYISELLEDYELTIALMAPSTINYLRPYFDEISVPSLRYSLFCGEALHEELTKEWSSCVPNACIYNVYGPTEDTIFCTFYEYKRNSKNKSHNGVLSIGRTMQSGQVRILDNDGVETKVGELGELCLYGDQLFDGYWKNKEKTNEVFMTGSDGKTYYKSGDLCYRDVDGDIMYSGRIDFQAKIQGYRVELGEIEFHARVFLNDVNVVCVSFENEQHLTEIAMFIESTPFSTDTLISKMREKMPPYMIPTKILFEPTFPLNINGKIDRNLLRSKI